MRLLADENIDRPITRWLTSQGHDAVEVMAEAPGATDESVIALSRRTNRVLLTFDRDIGRLLLADPRPHPGVVYLRLSGGAGALWDRFRIVWPSVEAIAPGHFVTVRDNRVRCRRLPMTEASPDGNADSDA